MHKLLLASLIALSLSAPAAMAQGVNINVGSGGVSTNLPSTLGSVGGVLNTLLGGQNNSGNNNQMVNGLPATNMDSFVYQAGGSAELIYGDEGVDDIPPYFEFTKEHRIAAGISRLDQERRQVALRRQGPQRGPCKRAATATASST